MRFMYLLNALSNELDDPISDAQSKKGELKVVHVLQSMQNLYGGHFLNDILLVDDQGAAAQIDHVYICRMGLFVIETRNYPGYIVGDENAEQWALYSGNQRAVFKNPYQQNKVHIDCLMQLLGPVPMVNTIIFVGAETERVTCPDVYTCNQFRHHLLKRSKEAPVFSDMEVESYANTLFASPNVQIRGVKA